MKTNWSCAPFLGALFAAGATFATQPAQAQSCANNADCDAGYECQTRTYENCWGGWDCGDDDGGCTMLPGECETIEESYCANAACSADAECPDHMACHAQTIWVCEGGGAAGTGGAGGGMVPGDEDGGYSENCYEAPGASICIPRYQLPCEAASDCGGGFDCVENYYWQCGGWGGSGGSAGTGGVGGAGGMAGGGFGGAPSDEDAGSDDDYTCQQIPSGTSSCELQDLPCDTHADCPSGLECHSQYYYPPCGWGGAGGMGGAGGGYYDECPSPEQRLRCMPPSYEGGGGSGGAGGAGGMGSGGSSGGEQDAGSDVGGMGGYGGAGGAGGGSAGTGAAGMSGGGDGSPDEDDESDESGHGGKPKKLKHLLKKLFGGCSTTGPTSSEGGLGWLVLGMTALVLRRRARKA